MCSRVICLLSVGLAAAQTAADPGATAKKALDLMLGGKYQELNQMFTTEGQKTYSVESLAKLGANIKARGTPGNIGAPTVTRPGANFVAVIPVSFASVNINYTIAVDSQGRLVVFLERPGEVTWQRPPYSKPDAFHDRAVTVGEDWKLPGTLSVPAGSGPFPGVVLVHDSGPNDRDETAFASKVFRDLAEGLASRGIVVLRYEKRTRQFAAKMASNAKTTVKEETTEDALKALALLRSQPEVNPQKTYLVGFGLGGYLAPRIAEEDGKLAGIAIVAGMARPLEDVMLDQFEYKGRLDSANQEQFAKDLEGVKKQVARVKKLESADASAPPIMGMSAAYILDLKGYEPAATAKDLPGRILVLQADRDFEVTAKDFNLWKTGLAGRKDTAFHNYPALNHLMVAGQGRSTEAEYRRPGHVAPEVVDDLAKWLAQ